MNEQFPVSLFPSELKVPPMSGLDYTLLLVILTDAYYCKHFIINLHHSSVGPMDALHFLNHSLKFQRTIIKGIDV
jgi:hypothetical protein